MIGIKKSGKPHTIGQKVGSVVNTIGQKLIPLAIHSAVHPSIAPHIVNLIEEHKSNSSDSSYMPMGLKHKKETSKKSSLEK